MGLSCGLWSSLAGKVSRSVRACQGHAVLPEELVSLKDRGLFPRRKTDVPTRLGDITFFPAVARQLYPRSSARLQDMLLSGLFCPWATCTRDLRGTFLAEVTVLRLTSSLVMAPIPWDGEGIMRWCVRYVGVRTVATYGGRQDRRRAKARAGRWPGLTWVDNTEARDAAWMPSGSSVLLAALPGQGSSLACPVPWPVFSVACPVPWLSLSRGLSCPVACPVRWPALGLVGISIHPGCTLPLTSCGPREWCYLPTSVHL